MTNPMSCDCVSNRSAASGLRHGRTGLKSFCIASYRRHLTRLGQYAGHWRTAWPALRADRLGGHPGDVLWWEGPPGDGGPGAAGGAASVRRLVRWRAGRLRAGADQRLPDRGELPSLGDPDLVVAAGREALDDDPVLHLAVGGRDCRIGGAEAMFLAEDQPCAQVGVRDFESVSAYGQAEVVAQRKVRAEQGCLGHDR